MTYFCKAFKNTVDYCKYYAKVIVIIIKRDDKKEITYFTISAIYSFLFCGFFLTGVLAQEDVTTSDGEAAAPEYDAACRCTCRFW